MTNKQVALEIWFEGRRCRISGTVGQIPVTLRTAECLLLKLKSDVLGGKDPQIGWVPEMVEAQKLRNDIADALLRLASDIREGREPR